MPMKDTALALEALAAEIRNAPVTIERRDTAYAAISQASVDLKVAVGQNELLRATLAFYADPANYDEGLPANSMMSADRGQKAEWVLRLTDPDPV